MPDHKMTLAKKAVRSSGLPVPAGSAFVRWADYDPDYRRNNRLQIYSTKADQRGNRPDLQPFRVLITVDAPRPQKCNTTNTQRPRPAGVATSKTRQQGKSSAGSQPMANTSRTTQSAKARSGRAIRARSSLLNIASQTAAPKTSQPQS